MNIQEKFPKKVAKAEIFPYQGILEDKRFQDWFSGSVVIDSETGNPLPVYHATSVKKIEGDNLKLNNSSEDWSSYGIYFSSDLMATKEFFSELYRDSYERFNKKYKYFPSEWSSKEDIQKKEEEAKYFEHNESLIKTFTCFLKIKKPLILDNHQNLMDTQGTCML